MSAGMTAWYIWAGDGECAELDLAQQQSEADQQRLWDDLSAHISGVYSRHLNVAVASAADTRFNLVEPAVGRQSQHFTDGQLSGVHSVGLSSDLQLNQGYPGQQSAVTDVYSAVNKAGMFNCWFFVFDRFGHTNYNYTQPNWVIKQTLYVMYAQLQVAWVASTLTIVFKCPSAGKIVFKSLNFLIYLPSQLFLIC